MNRPNPAKHRSVGIAAVAMIVTVSGCVVHAPEMGRRVETPTASTQTASTQTASTQTATPPVTQASAVTTPRTDLRANSDQAIAPAVRPVGFITDHLRGGGSCGVTDCGPVASGACAACGPEPIAAMPAYMPPNPYAIDPNEFLCNGGDLPPLAHVTRDGDIAGLDVTDAVAHYITDSADVEVKPSNRVCVYAPRFNSVRKITSAQGQDFTLQLAQSRRDVMLGAVGIDTPPLVQRRNQEIISAEVTRRTDAVRDRAAGVRIERVDAPVQSTDYMAALVNLRSDQVADLTEDQRVDLQRFSAAAITYTLDQEVEVGIGDVFAATARRTQAAEAFTLYEFPEDGRLEVLKLVDKLDALPGDNLTFTITVRNVGDSPVHAVTIADNLVTRLAYIDGSQTSTAQAAFEMLPNTAGSSRLRWLLDEPLGVGDSATVTFRCKVR